MASRRFHCLRMSTYGRPVSGFATASRRRFSSSVLRRRAANAEVLRSLAQRGRAARHLLAVVKMMGDTSVATVNPHYFNLEDDVMQEIIDGWAVPDVEVFAADLEPVWAETALDDDEAPATPVQPAPRRARN